MTINFDPRSVFACYLQGTYLATRKLSFSWRGSPPLLPPAPTRAGPSTLPTQCRRELPLLAKQLRRSPLRPPPLRAHQHPWRSHNPPVLTKHLGDLSPPTKRLRTASHPSQPPTTPPCPPAPLEVPQSPGTHQAPWRSLPAHQAATPGSNHREFSHNLPPPLFTKQLGELRPPTKRPSLRSHHRGATPPLPSATTPPMVTLSPQPSGEEQQIWTSAKSPKRPKRPQGTLHLQLVTHLPHLSAFFGSSHLCAPVVNA